MKRHIAVALATSALTIVMAPSAAADYPVAIHANLQSDILLPETDYKIGTRDYSDAVLTNSYLDLTAASRNVDAGLRFEYLQHPLPGFDEINDFRGWGVPHFYVTGKYKGVELTAGDIYEQFGSGFILRTYEERTLGIDNAIRGARMKVNALRGVRLTMLGGVQRRFWDWTDKSQVYGANLELYLQDHIKWLSDRGVNWMVGGSYVLKREETEDKVIAGTNYKLNFPRDVNAFDIRSQVNKGGLEVLAEYAWKSQDPTAQNNYTYGHGSAMMLSASYSKTGFGALLQAKRSDNMDFRSRRSEEEAASFINQLPPFAYQHTYTLAALYPYATQAAPGEWAFQGSLSAKFKKGTPMGGRYGTKLTLNGSYICAIDRKPVEKPHDTFWGTDWWEKGIGGLGETYYADVNLQMEKRLTKDFQLNAMYMFQKYNKGVVEGHGGMVNSNIFVADMKYRINKNNAIRIEAQYLQTCDDQKDWLFGLVEYSLAPHFMLSVSDQWNVGDTNLHYYLASVTMSDSRNRLLLGYGRTRAGYNCAGGVCRYIPATRGLQMSYSYNF